MDQTEVRASREAENIRAVRDGRDLLGEIEQLQKALRRIRRDSRMWIAAAKEPAEAIPFYEIGSIARVALGEPPYSEPTR